MLEAGHSAAGVDASKIQLGSTSMPPPLRRLWNARPERMKTQCARGGERNAPPACHSSIGVHARLWTSEHPHLYSQLNPAAGQLAREGVAPAGAEPSSTAAHCIDVAAIRRPPEALGPPVPLPAALLRGAHGCG